MFVHTGQASVFAGQSHFLHYFVCYHVSLGSLLDGKLCAPLRVTVVLRAFAAFHCLIKFRVPCFAEKEPLTKSICSLWATHHVAGAKQPHPIVKTSWVSLPYKAWVLGKVGKVWKDSTEKSSSTRHSLELTGPIILWPHGYFKLSF